MTWLCGAAATCAGHTQRASKQPETIDFAFLGQTHQAPYYRAFAADSLSRSEIADAAEQHLRRAAEQAGWQPESWHRAPVFVASSTYLISEYENRRAAHIPHLENHLLYLAGDLAQRSGNRSIFNTATACTSSAHALMQAHRLLSHDLAARAFVLGIENLNRLTLLHFHSLGLFAQQYQPFHGNGLILGEGAAALALSADAPPRKGSLKLIATAANTGSHLVQSHAETQARLIRRVLQQADLAPSRIALVKTHGIGTADTDAAELAALNDVFGTPPPLVAFKPQIGHTLGASAALETALLAEALRRRTLTDIHGRSIPLSNHLYCLAHHFGFGGSNTASIWQWTS
ncbi:3-oxoacyl-[acyl-carrier-protein] synthase 2 [Kingella potus]|uniref:3-oxoacyl-[acyl-carrier-protein] synthase 2 n=1 Tax=Kingella potus TaxID=265175 RepID=A0A377R1Y9_9NEIS|nr:beta-ketoacyl synthase N-terminal-like domain-containing protein [Kingella potus]UOP00655.1 beta-ketoacyl synthase [Kingella potus]STR02948.1 3-oxoacyl-[acyl-carrier-protein] synthase 2 [Kingella potus]